MNSVLNPEAPEFHPLLSATTQEGFTSVRKTIKSSNHMPTGASRELFKTFTDFNSVTSQISENVIIQSNEIIKTELPAVKLKCNENDYNTEKIIDANDSMLDRTNVNIDSESGVNKTSDKFLEGVQKSHVASWNRHTPPVLAKLQVGSTSFIGAKNIPRPQLTFKDPIDNSANLWVPKISDKPNNIKPLALTIVMNDDGEPVGYEHPYLVELDVYQPPLEFIDPDPLAPTFPPPLEDTEITFVATEEQVDQLVNHLAKVKAFAVDVEHHSYRTYQGITCLIQITTDEGGDFIIDALAAREHLHKLNLAFTDPKKLKVFHGAEMDVLWLQRDFGVYIVGLFDTFQAAKALQINGLSLKNLLMKYCGVNADKKYQLADWRIRPLPVELVKYARMDTHYLLYIWRRMKAELIEAGGGQTTLLLSVFEQSRQICGQTYNKTVVDETSHMGLYVRSKKSFNSQQMAALQLLYKWRDAQARELDESTMYLMPNHMLLTLAETLPREIQGINACCSPMPPFVKQNLIAIHRIILSCRELPMEPQLYQIPNSIRNMMNTTHPSVVYNVHDFSQFPEIRSDLHINLDRANLSLQNYRAFQPDVQAFIPKHASQPSITVVSDLNVDAKMFVPPYDRYRKYRSIAQLEELKEYKDKEAKIAALGKGNELIKREVLIKIQQAKTQVENEETTPKDLQEKPDKVKNQAGKKRKRKMSYDKGDRKKSGAQIEEKSDLNSIASKNNDGTKTSKTFSYKNVNYRKFYDDSEKEHNKSKMKFKKHK